MPLAETTIKALTFALRLQKNYDDACPDVGMGPFLEHQLNDVIEAADIKASKRDREKIMERYKDLYEPKPPPKPDEICTACGAEMVPRSGRYGDFYGCSNFPKCKNTYNPRKRRRRYSLYDPDIDIYEWDDWANFGD